MESNVTFTNTSNSPLEEEQFYWWFSVIVNSLLILVVLWVSISIAVFGFKTGKFQQNYSAGLNEAFFLKMAITSVLLLFPRFVASVVLTTVGFNENKVNNHVCELAVDISAITYGIGVMPVYISLWYRQKTLFEQPINEKIYTRAIKCLSYIFLFVMLGMSIIFELLIVLPTNFRGSKQGCVFIDEKHSNDLFYFMVMFLVFNQLMILSLLLYPLCRHRSFIKQSNISRGRTDNETGNHIHRPSSDAAQSAKTSNVTDPTRNAADVDNMSRLDELQQESLVQQPENGGEQRQVKPSDKILWVMQRACVCAVVCIVSDTIIFILSATVVRSHYPVFFGNALFSINLIINALSFVCSFARYKEMLFPCYIKQN